MSRDSINGNEPKKKDKEILNSRINRADKVCAMERVSGDSQMNRMGNKDFRNSGGTVYIRKTL